MQSFLGLECKRSLIARHQYVTRVMPPRVSFYKKWQTTNISVAFGSFFTYQVKEATESLLLLLGDYLLQPSKAKRGGGLEPCRRFRIDQSVHGKFDTALL